MRLYRLTPRTLVERYRTLAEPLSPANITPVVQRDPNDDTVLACALTAHAQLIVSGDKDLLDITSFRNIPILSPAQAFLRINTTE